MTRPTDPAAPDRVASLYLELLAAARARVSEQRRALTEAEGAVHFVMAVIEARYGLRDGDVVRETGVIERALERAPRGTPPAETGAS